MHEKKHFVRAVMEGVAYSLRDCMEVLKEMNIPIDNMLVVGGGVKSALWREIMAGAYGMPIQLMSSQEGAALGAAILGGVAANMYPSVETACRRLCKPSQMQESKNADEYNRIYSVYKSIYPSVKDIYKSIKNL